MVFHHRQKVLTENMIPELAINNNTIIERVKEFDFLGLTLNENMDWSSHCHKIANTYLSSYYNIQFLNPISLTVLPNSMGI